ncbi:oxidoreductase [Rhodobacterales bacterium LSUCC0031]|nr:oxidoreductase [Rhodobacterales bacterium LSUCC0031]
MSIRHSTTLLLAAAAIAFGTSTTALEPAQGPIVLTVTGAISHTNADDAAALDLALLEAMGSVVVETSTIWTDGVQTFEGVELASLLATLGAEGTVLRAIAHNDYAVDIPVSDAVAGGPVVAYMRNGAPMSMRDKGPLWIIYPFDSSPEYQSELIYSRSIWQLDRIEVQP